MIVILITYAIIALICLVFIQTIDWSVHLKMTREHCNSVGWASYKKFKNHYNKYKWGPMPYTADGYEDRTNSCKYFASIIRMNGKGMLIRDPISYMLVKRYVKKKFKREKVVW